MVKQALLTRLIEQSRRRRDEVAGDAAEARRVTERATATLTQLQDYRRDYDAKTPKQLQRQTEVASIMRHEGFVARLDVAVLDQGRRRTTAQNEQSSREQDLMAAQRRLKAFETLQTRQAEATRKRLARQDQRTTDEQATRLTFWKDSP